MQLPPPSPSSPLFPAPAARRLAILRAHIPLAILALALALALTLAPTPRSAHAGPSLVPVSSDPYTDPNSQHKTEVEPDSYAYGSTIVFAFQTARYFDGGSDDIGWATSTDGGATWHNGFLPGITGFQGGGPYARVSDPAVAYDPYHHIWMIASLAIDSSVSGAAVLVSTSPDGLTWAAPVQVANANGGFFDKDWIACYVNPFTPLTGQLPGNNKSLGHCYVEWDLASSRDEVLMSTSGDGGQTWSASISPSDTFGLGGQPVVQPNGNVVVPYLTTTGDIDAFMSTNAGASWSSAVTIAHTSTVCDAGCNMRSEQLPSAQVGPSGTVYVTWSDCRFENGCPYNDIVMSTSSDGTHWSAVQMVPIDAAGSGADHIVPGLGVDRFNLGPGDHLGLVYYELPNANCNPNSNCTLTVGYISSTNGGASWSAPTILASGINILWLASTNQGYMVGDYESLAFSGGHAFPCFAVASAPSSTLIENMDTATGLSALGGARLAVKAPSGGGTMSRGGFGRGGFGRGGFGRGGFGRVALAATLL